MPIGSNTRRAGAYADQRYKRGRRNYRRRARPIFAVIFGPFILAGFVILALDGHALAWIAGLTTGALGACWFVMRDEPPFYIEKWNEGAQGERKTAKALKPLERSGLQVFHDVQSPRGNYDHIAVGLGGVFLLETKNPKGVVEIREGVPHVCRRLDPDANDREGRVRPRTLSAAARLKAEIEHRTGLRPWVQAVIVYWCEFPEGVVEDDRCVFIHGPRLRSWVTGHPEVLDQLKVDEIAPAIASIADDEQTAGDADVPEQRGFQRYRL